MKRERERKRKEKLIKFEIFCLFKNNYNNFYFKLQLV